LEEKIMLLGAMTILSTVAAVVTFVLTGVFWTLPLAFVGSFLGLGVVVFLVLWISCLCVDLNKPQEEESKYFRFLMKLIPRTVLTILLARVHTRGLEQTPTEGRFMLVCNHINDLDPVTLMGYFPNSQLAFITKRENMSMFLVGKIMHKILCQPINRENDKEALKTILKCISLIKEDKASVAVFPEGYTSMDGLLHRFRHGVFKIALKTKVPIVVCTLQNTNKVFKNIAKLKKTDVHLHLLKVIQPEEYEGLTAVELGERIHKLMADDLGPDLVLQG
jgi:1-acyl-sn-glycerol-3-phosphate acyltransferase